ncbi:hypothetical protein RHMOL_Rhmol12G0204300 [Rhododendron molle]|uniref:Uncharacterized protein n=1 Tax=Rhododendron molle TaxID=49168 RepID=A0ACC0LKQ2_RHOML|nr:hypothetical protein RHMOL_Rhmol12G0204300 [Rhododendron molle]
MCHGAGGGGSCHNWLKRTENPKKTEAARKMRLFQLLISHAEAVACRYKSYASVLLSELRASAFTLWLVVPPCG